MALKIFSIKNKATGVVERLVKADTRGQVNKHLVASVEVEPVGAVELMEMVAANNTLRVEDATAQPADAGADAGDAAGEPAAGDAAAPAANAGGEPAAE